MTSTADEVYSSGDELATKVRKPYTITKQRERWTEEEHQKFLEALKLYGRAWRRIEEHIGTKTAVQTRSHAQKFFSKLVRESSGGGVCSVGQAQNIEIPPPRPKRKPRHPYPRKAGPALQSGSSPIEGGIVSPPPVSFLPELCLGVGLDKNAGFDRCNEAENLCDNISTQESEMERARTNTSPSSLKLFGQTMFVATVQRTTGASVKPFVSNNSGGAFREFSSLKQAIVPEKAATYDEQRLDEGKELEQALGPTAHMKLVAKPAKYSGSAFDATMTSVLETGMLAGCGLSGADGKHADKQDSGEHLSCKLDINSTFLPRKQEAPNFMTGHPRHVPVQCVVDGMVPESIHKCAKSWPILAPLVHQSSAMSMPNGNSSFLNSDTMNSWPSRFPPGFPWMQMQQGDTSAAGAVAAANVAAASACWSFYGAAPSPFIYPAIYAAANPTFACNGEHLMGARQQKKMKMTEREGENLLSVMPINLQMDTEGKPNSFHKQNDSKSLILEASDHADCMSQGSQSQNYTPSCMEESNDIGGHVEEQSCETEEPELKMKDRWLSKEGSSSGSNTPSSNEAEIDPCLGTSTEDNMGDYVQDFQFSGGRCVSEAEEDAPNEKEEARDCNNPSMKQAEVMDKSGKHIYKDRCNGWSKGDGHFNEIWKEVSDEGRAAFQALFAEEVLPQSFSLPNNFGYTMYPKADTKESLYEDTKQSLGKICENKVELEVQCTVTAQNARYTGNGHTYRPRTSDTTQKVLEVSGVTISVQSEESATENSSCPTTECAAVNVQEAIKCMDTPSFGSCRSGGVGFVPYQRCSMQANKKLVIPGNL